MGLFSWFKGNKGEGGAPSARNAERYADRANDKRAQAPDRGEAIEQLAKMGTPEAAAILLRRFTFTIDPSITDQDEKDVAFDGVVRAGREGLEVIRAFAEKAESVTWPLRAMRAILPVEEYVEETLKLLGRWDTEYSKFVDPKLQLLAALEDQNDPRIVDAVLPFLEDVNETARFHAAATLLAQQDERALAPLAEAFSLEESARVQKRITEGFIKLGWAVPEAQRPAVQKVLPHEVALQADGSFQFLE